MQLYFTHVTLLAESVWLIYLVSYEPYSYILSAAEAHLF